MRTASRERVVKAISFGGPDRLPVYHGVLPGTLLKYGDRLKEVLNKFESDFLFDSIAPEIAAGLPNYRVGECEDDWGCVWRNAQGGMIGQVVGHPLSEWDRFGTYKFPDPEEDPVFDLVESFLEGGEHEKYIQIPYGLNFFERMQWLRGYENLLVDLLERPGELELLMEGILEYNIKSIGKLCELSVDGISFADDWGTQTALMMSPELWRRLFKPAYREMFDEAHRRGRFADFHSDGYIVDILPDLIEVGADVLNVQLPIMGIGKVGEEFGGKVCFRCDLDRQHILPRGTVAEVEEHAGEVISAFADFGGGLIGGAEFGPDVPLENIEAVCRTFYEWGTA